MIPGESLNAKAAQDAETPELDAMATAPATPDDSDNSPDDAAENDFLTRTMQGAPASDTDAVSPEEHFDAEWVRTERDESVPEASTDDDAEEAVETPLFADADAVDAEISEGDAEVSAATLADPQIEDIGAGFEAFDTEHEDDTPEIEDAPAPILADAPEADDSDTSPEDDAGSTNAPEEAQPAAEDAEPTPVTSTDIQNTEALGLQAITALGERITSNEQRFDASLQKISHAIGVIAERIDGLESKMAEQTINAIAANSGGPGAPQQSFGIADSKVAPYLANAERELASKKSAAPVDIFDRIAHAAETEFNTARTGTAAGAAAHGGDGRRVGTKKWTPSRTVKRRMAQLEKAKTNGGAAAPADSETTTAPQESADFESTVPPIADPRIDAAKARAPEPEAFADEPMGSDVQAHFDGEDEEEDDSGLSVVPGARGRRRNRARKSRLDEDFETIFEDEGGEPSIGSLRRKLRQNEPPAEEEPKDSGGLIGKLLKRNRKPSDEAAAAPKKAEIGEDEDDLKAAFGMTGTPAADAPVGKSKPRKATPAQEDLVEDEDELEALELEDQRSNSLIYLLLGAAAAALAAGGFFFLG